MFVCCRKKNLWKEESVDNAVGRSGLAEEGIRSRYPVSIVDPESSVSYVIGRPSEDQRGAIEEFLGCTEEGIIGELERSKKEAEGGRLSGSPSEGRLEKVEEGETQKRLLKEK
ncbi:MAG: uncharacterized protein A8A55_0018 [Amphiamblys sp. WSBS2006]|nr:MAG: uncharacterized protein A8A55_0018 [Amphiamblys sp. WSBS2006]